MYKLNIQLLFRIVREYITIIDYIKASYIFVLFSILNQVFILKLTEVQLYLLLLIKNLSSSTSQKKLRNYVTGGF
jgi:hypothetical protein